MEAMTDYVFNSAQLFGFEMPGMSHANSEA